MSNVPAKYIKDENGNIISPIVHIGSVVDDGGGGDLKDCG